MVAPMKRTEGGPNRSPSNEGVFDQVMAIAIALLGLSLYGWMFGGVWLVGRMMQVLYNYYAEG